MSGVIDEYMVKLGASVDASGMQRFYQALREASNVSEASASSISSAFLKTQTEIVGGFVAIGTAVLGMVDKVAMADQQYRMFAMHMFISKDAARSLKIGMDALGASMGEIRWDPTGELQGRMAQLQKDQMAMAPSGDYDAQMRKIRDIRFEFTRMDVEMQLMGMNVVQAFMKSLGSGPDALLNKLQAFNKYIIDNMPGIVDKIVKLFGPVWQDLKDVFGATTEAAKAAGTAFTNLVGIFDPSVSSTTFDLEKFAKALTDIVHTFAVWVENIAKVEEGLAHLTSATALAARGKLGMAGKELGAASQDVTPGSVGTGLPMAAVTAVGGWKLFRFIAKKFGFGVAKKVAAGEAVEAVGAEGVLAAAGEGAVEGSPGGPWGMIGMALLSAGAAMGGSYLLSMLADKVFGTGTAGAASTSPSELSKQAADLAQSVSKTTGIKPDLLWSQWAHETGGFTHLGEANNLAGIRIPGSSEYQSFGSLDEFGKRYAEVVGNTSRYAGLSGAQNTDEFAAMLKHGGYYEDSQQNYAAGLAHYDSMYKGGAANGGSVTVGSMTININKPHPSNDEVAGVITRRLQDLQGKAVQRNLAQQQDYAYDY